ENAVPTEVTPGPSYWTLATVLEMELGRTIAHIALVLWAPVTLTNVLFAWITADPLACIRSPDLLAGPGLAVLSMVAPFTFMLMSAPGVEIAPVVFAALTASTTGLPVGTTTRSPGRSVRVIGVLLVG